MHRLRRIHLGLSPALWDVGRGISSLMLMVLLFVVWSNKRSCSNPLRLKSTSGTYGVAGYSSPSSVWLGIFPDRAGEQMRELLKQKLQ